MPCRRRNGRKSFSEISPARKDCDFVRKVSISSRTVASCLFSKASRSERPSPIYVDIIALLLVEINSPAINRDYHRRSLTKRGTELSPVPHGDPNGPDQK